MRAKWAAGLAMLLLAGMPAASGQETVRIFFGNLHAHTGLSDGSGTAEEAFRYARDVARLDFLAVTEHNHLLGGSNVPPERRKALYDGPGDAALVPVAKRMTEDGRFVALYGQEFSTMSKGNHVNVFDVPKVIDVASGDFAGLLRWMAANPDSGGRPAVLQLNHPMLGRPGKSDIGPKEFGRDDFGDDAGWIRAMGGAASLVEILNGEPPKNAPSTRAPQIMEPFYLRFLQLGFRVAPTGNQDNHHGQWGTVTEARTAILAPALTTKDLLDAMRARHVYATEDRNLRILARVNGRLCGDALTMAAKELAIEVTIEDADESDAEYLVEVFRGEVGGPTARIVQTAKFRGDTATGSVPGVSLDRVGQYVFLRVTQSGAPPDRAWTAPVWLDPASTASR